MRVSLDGWRLSVSVAIPSYGELSTPFRTASQRRRFSSSIGPRCSSASLGSLAYFFSSCRRRCVVCGDDDAIRNVRRRHPGLTAQEEEFGRDKRWREE